MSNGQKGQPSSAAPQGGPPTGGWGGEYDADATGFIQLPGPGEQLSAPDSGEGGGGYSPLAAPGTGAGWEPPTIPPMTPAASTDPAATGQWTMPFAPMGSQYPAAAEPDPAQQPTDAAALGQGAAAALAGAHEARTQPDPAPGFPAEDHAAGARPAPAHEGPGVHGAYDPLDPATPLDVAAAAVSQPSHTGQPTYTGQPVQPSHTGQPPQPEHHSGQWHLGEPVTERAAEHTGAPPSSPEGEHLGAQGAFPFGAPHLPGVPTDGGHPAMAPGHAPEHGVGPGQHAPAPEQAPGLAEPQETAPTADSGEPFANDVPATDLPANDVPATDLPAAELPVTETGPADAADATDATVAGPAEDTEHPLESYVLHVNGADRPVTDAWIGESLLYVLRERLGLAGAKDGCSQGECGACSVQVDGRLVASCLVPAATAAESEVRTVEGLAKDGEPSDVQRALAERAGAHCGFCVPGMAMTVHDLLEGNHAPNDLEVRKALCGNLCRCSGYRGVLEAVREVSDGRAAAASDAHAAHASPQQYAEQRRNRGAGGAEPRIPQQARNDEQQAGPEEQGGAQ